MTNFHKVRDFIDQKNKEIQSFLSECIMEDVFVLAYEKLKEDFDSGKYNFNKFVILISKEWKDSSIDLNIFENPATYESILEEFSNKILQKFIETEIF